MLLFVCFLITLGVTLSKNVSDTSSSLPPFYCFKKISAGERLITYTVTRIVERNSIRGCEQECDIYKCTYFSYGFINGNGTCELTTDRQISRRPDLKFDLFEKTKECIQGKPTGYESGNGRQHRDNRRLYLIQACYRQVFSGKRLHEKFIRHSLPCNSLEACQHQCSIEKHFDCQGFNIRLDPARVGRGICELSSFRVTHLDQSRDFIYDPEFVYYERVYSNDYPNCGYFSHFPNGSPHDLNTIRPDDSIRGGPYYGGDSYGPWSTGFGTENHGPWGSHGYGSGFYVSNNPSRGPVPSFQPNTPPRQYSYGNGGQLFYGNGYQERTPSYLGGKPQIWNPSFSPQKYPLERDKTYDKTYDKPNRIPTYIIIDAEVNGHNRENNQNNLQPYRRNFDYLPPKPQNLPGGFDNLSPGSPYLPPRRQNNPPRPQTVPAAPEYLPPANSNDSTKSKNLPPLEPQDVPRQPQNVPQGQKNEIPQSKNLPPTPTVYPESPQNLPSTPRDEARRPHVYPAKPEDLPASPRVQPSPQPYTPPHDQSHPTISFYDSPKYISHGSSHDIANDVFQATGREVCFQRAHPGYRLNPDSIRGMYDTPNVLECEAMCTGSSFKCTGYSFRYSISSNSVPNCLLTDFNSLTPETHLLPDRSCDVYFKMGGCLDLEKTSNTECFLKVTSNRKIDSSKVARSVSVGSISDCELACLNSGYFTCRSFSFRFGSEVIGEPEDNCFLSDWPITALSHQDFVPSPNQNVYERGSYGHGCELDVGSNLIGPKPSFIDYPITTHISQDRGSWNAHETWQHFTVNGWPCKLGSKCELNADAGFWYCEVEGGDRTQWDYCCRPKHSCGYSRGYSYPWCYVGEAGPEQWRPCSEQYYPEYGNRFLYKPAQSHNSHPADSYGSPRDTRPWNFGDDFGPPSYWPISYLYAEAPPNETYIWDDEPFNTYYYHHHYDSEDISLEENEEHEHYDEGPTIKFKPYKHKFPYPKAIVQKLDLRNVSKASNPEEQMLTDEYKEPKKAKSLEKVPVSDIVLGFSSNNQIKDNLKADVNFFPTNQHEHYNASAEFFLGKRELNKSNLKLKSTDVIETMQKIEEHGTTTESSEIDKNEKESLKKIETKYPIPFLRFDHKTGLPS